MAEFDGQLAEKISLSCRILAREGQGDATSGHVSARSAGSTVLHMKPNGLGLDEIEPLDIILIDLEGNKVGGSGRRRHVEFPIHTEIYKKRPDVNCLIHTHPPFAVAFGAVGRRLRPIGHDGVPFADLPLFTETGELIKTPEQGRALAVCLGQGRAVLMRNHGVVVVGGSVEEATVLAISLEKAMKVQFLAELLGNPVWSSEAECQRKMQQIYYPGNIEDLWQYYVRHVTGGKIKDSPER
jgi:ribulose-5-phosphate 4-epimerase/fuculose-1-phosphate aldolase